MLLFHNSIRKYTLAILETFNNLKVEYNNNGTLAYKNIPIKYSAREKINLLNETDKENILNGNYNILPRSSLTLSSVVRNLERQSNKFVRLSTNNFGEFIFNASSFDFSFDLTVMCRGMNEASSIVEQVASRFNPTYTLLINEIPNQIKPTSVPIQLIEISMEADPFDEMSSNIVVVSISLLLKGNFYQPLEVQEKIKHIDMYLNMWYNSVKNDYNRAKKFEYDVDNNLAVLTKEIQLSTDEGEFGKIPPVILDLQCNDSVEVGKTLNITCLWKDDDNKLDELDFSWSVNGNATLSSNKDKATLVGNSTETIEIFCIITDVNNNTSNLFNKKITVI